MLSRVFGDISLVARISFLHYTTAKSNLEKGKVMTKLEYIKVLAKMNLLGLICLVSAVVLVLFVIFGVINLDFYSVLGFLVLMLCAFAWLIDSPPVDPNWLKK